jgi:hypothetical protein
LTLAARSELVAGALRLTACMFVSTSMPPLLLAGLFLFFFQTKLVSYFLSLWRVTGGDCNPELLNPCRPTSCTRTTRHGGVYVIPGVSFKRSLSEHRLSRDSAGKRSCLKIDTASYRAINF